MEMGEGRVTFCSGNCNAFHNVRSAAKQLTVPPVTREVRCPLQSGALFVVTVAHESLVFVLGLSRSPERAFDDTVRETPLKRLKKTLQQSSPCKKISVRHGTASVTEMRHGQSSRSGGVRHVFLHGNHEHSHVYAPVSLPIRARFRGFCLLHHLKWSSFLA